MGGYVKRCKGSDVSVHRRSWCSCCENLWSTSDSCLRRLHTPSSTTSYVGSMITMYSFMYSCVSVFSPPPPPPHTHTISVSVCDSLSLPLLCLFLSLTHSLSVSVRLSVGGKAWNLEMNWRMRVAHTNVTRVNTQWWRLLMLDFLLDTVWLGVSYFSIGVMPLQPVYVLGQVTVPPPHPPPQECNP